jgi:hypothetical protein
MRTGIAIFVALSAGTGCQKPAQSAVAAAPAPAPKAPSFRQDVLPEIQKTCLGAEGCHGNKPTDSVHLDLRADAAYSELVNRPAEARKGGLRVKAGEPSASFLIDKLTGQLGPREGKKMPLDENTGAALDPSPVSAAFIDGVLKPWIGGGAPDD